MKLVTLGRGKTRKRDSSERVNDWREVELGLEDVAGEGSRCMDCGVAFCHKGCPLGNRVPEWNESIAEGDLASASAALHATNNFPEITGRICPAPCEDACVLNLQGEPVAIRAIERDIADRSSKTPRVAKRKTGKRVVVVGSGPAGLAAAQQLARAGHAVRVLERDDRIGGLLRYGIPDFKLEKATIDARIAQMTDEGVVFETGVEVGRSVSLEALRDDSDAVCLAVGALGARELDVPGRDLPGVHLAMAYLDASNRHVAGDVAAPAIDARGKRVIILGGGDTGADCLGTALRQGAASVRHFHYKPSPPGGEDTLTTWPYVPMTLRDSSSHEEGGERGFAIVAKGFEGTGRVERLRVAHVDWREGVMREVSEETYDADLVLIAVGFEGVERETLTALALPHAKGRLTTDPRFRTALPGVFVVGDARRGASLVVWAIWEGREAAREIDLFLMGESKLPSSPNDVPLVRGHVPYP